MEKYKKYPRTPHLPWSPGASPDDLVASRLELLERAYVVVTEKMDGENTTMYRDHLHARSLDSRHHPSRSWVKQLHQHIAHLIPDGWRLCGENLYAKHSIEYNGLDSYFLLFSIWDDHDRCLSWDDTLEWAALLDLHTPPLLYRGPFDHKLLLHLASSLDTEHHEGYVVRDAASFHFDDFSHHIAKWVRPHHVQTDQHWMLGPVIPNQLKASSD
jgi:hypothetical protein